MWPGVRPAVFGEISSGKKYGGKTPVVRVPVARCPAVKWVDTMVILYRRALPVEHMHAETPSDATVVENATRTLFICK